MDASNAALQSDDTWTDAAIGAGADVGAPVDQIDDRPAAILRGTARGLEVVVHGRATVDAITTAMVKWLDKAPGFFKGSDVRIRVDDGPLPSGCLGRLDEIAQTFELRIVEVLAARPVAGDVDAVPQPNLAAGSAPAPASANDFEETPTNSAAAALLLDPPDRGLATLASRPSTLPPSDLDDLTELVHVVEESTLAFEEPTQTAVPLQLANTSEIELETLTNETRLVVGPVRSGVILEHTGHLIVFGDVNPGAEVRAEGNIVVLGRLRGTAHAGIGQELGFILALQLEPQQLRIGRKVARAGDDAGAAGAEIAYATGDTIVVERYQGKLPRNLASSI